MRCAQPYALISTLLAVEACKPWFAVWDRAAHAAVALPRSRRNSPLEWATAKDAVTLACGAGAPAGNVIENRSIAGRQGNDPGGEKAEPDEVGIGLHRCVLGLVVITLL